MKERTNLDHFFNDPVDKDKRIAELEAQLSAQAGQEPVATRWHTCGDGKWSYSSGPIGFNADDWQELTYLYAAPPAPANALAIVQAALEAAAKVCDLKGHGAADSAANNIRAIDPKTIINQAMKGRQ